jgi:hypothetical protein
MTETKPKRRWLRFSLRMLFVLVTIASIAAGWVAYQLNRIRQRHEFSAMAYADNCKFDPTWPKDFPFISNEVAMPTISIVQQLLGDQAYRLIILPEKYQQDRIDEANALFPEALIHQWRAMGPTEWGQTTITTISVKWQ